MRGILIAAAASMIAAGSALAADLPVARPAPAYYPVATVYDWGGGYFGINGGYAFGQSDWSDPGNPSGLGSTGNFHVGGGLVGGRLAKFRLEGRRMSAFGTKQTSRDGVS